MEKTLRKSQVNSTVGATEILVWNVFKRDTQWIALSQNMKNVNLLKLGNLGRIEIKGLKIKADGKNYLIANTKGKCK